MSRFYASIRGSAKTEATRQGTAKSGIQGHIRGWDVGVKVYGIERGDGHDAFAVYTTGGSNGRWHDTLIGHVIITDNGPRFIQAG